MLQAGSIGLPAKAASRLSLLARSGSLKDIRIQAAEVEAIYAGLHVIGALGVLPEHGYDRPAYSTAETAAMQHIEHLAQNGGLLTRWDAVGNLIVEMPGDYAEWIETGSHIDTVPGGGNYDGTAGVVAGLAVLLSVHEQGLMLGKGLRLRVWRGEESSSFGVVSIGSRAAFGVLPVESLQRVYHGVTLAEAMRMAGANPDLIELGEPAIKAAERDAIAAYVELHIEQGKVLETEAADVGVVSGIRGSVRSWVKLHGVFDHSGATPMGTSYRSDVNLAMAYMQVRLDELVQEALQQDEDIVQTIGVINSSTDMNRAMPEVLNNAVARVSGAAYFSHEVRSCSGAAAKAFTTQAFAVIHETAAEFGVRAEIETFSQLPGVMALDDGIQDLAATLCLQSGMRYLHLPSGAWHDAAVLCGAARGDGSEIPVGMLFVPCRGGVSHSAAEYVSDTQLALGASVLGQVMLTLAHR